jgi:hypothetical protein
VPEAPHASGPGHGLRVCTECAGALPHACLAPLWCACEFCEHPADPRRDTVLDVVRKHLAARAIKRERNKRKAS